MRGKPGELIESVEIDGRRYQIRRGPEANAPHRTEVWWRIGHRHNGRIRWHLDLYSNHRIPVAMDIAELDGRLIAIHGADVEAAKLDLGKRSQS